MDTDCVFNLPLILQTRCVIPERPGSFINKGKLYFKYKLYIPSQSARDLFSALDNTYSKVDLAHHNVTC